MNKLRLKLLLSLIAFALILVVVISYVNREILVADIEQQQAINRTLIENHILTDMQSVDNAHLYFDNNISDKMEQELQALAIYYEKKSKHRYMGFTANEKTTWHGYIHIRSNQYRHLHDI